MDKDPKHTAKSAQDFLKVKTWTIVSVSCLISTQQGFFPKTEGRPTNKQELKVAAEKCYPSVKIISLHYLYYLTLSKYF